MAKLRMIEFLCAACGLRFEHLAEGVEIEASTRECACGAQADRAISAPGLRVINFGNHDFRERQDARLRARADAHAVKTRDEGIDREREQMKKNFA